MRAQPQALLVVLEGVSGAKNLRLLAQRSEAFAWPLVSASAAPAAGSWPEGGQPAAGASVASTAAASWALRCLESMVGREVTFPLAPAAIAAAVEAAAAAVVALPPPPDSWQALAGGLQRLAALYSSATGLLVAVVRHRLQAARRLMGLLLPAVEQLLRTLLAWDVQLRLAWLALAAGSASNSSQSAAMPLRQQQQYQQPAALVLRCAEQLAR